MQGLASYVDVVDEVSREIDRSIARALGAGIGREMIIVDPGIGFAKKTEHNLTLLRNLPALKAKGYPLLVGLSRKSFLGALTGLPAEERLVPTVAAEAIAIFQGADIIRVHDVREAVITVKVADALKKA
jgi:dihydropteroate synthase